MKLRALFLILAAMVLALGGVAAVASYGVSTTLFFIAEGLVVVVLMFLIFFYRRTMLPLDTLANGLDILNAQDWNTTLRYVGQSEVDRIAATFNHMLACLKNQRIRYEERSRLVDLLVRTAPAGVVILGFDGSPKIVNAAAAAMISGSPGLRPFLQTVARGHTADFITAGGGTLRCSCHSFADRGIAHSFYMIEDITASISTAERAVYEKIIRTISHEVNNTLGGLSSAFDTIGSVLADTPGMDGCHALMSSCAERFNSLGDFISRYTEMVRLPPAVLVPTSVGQFVARSAPFLQSIGSQAGVPVDMEISPDTVMASLDGPLLEQALVNIVRNAVESAVSRPDGAGRVTVSTARDSAGRAVITVTDNGPGISDEKSRRIFTPFFTDKPQGHGIGLTLVRDILNRHHAGFTLFTDPNDHLTRFTITMPL